MIIIVDDNALIANNIAEYLEIQGFSTEAYYDGESAFENISRKLDLGEKIELIILDRMMPRLDGVGLLRLMRSRKINIPVLFLTALGKPIDTLEGLEAGAIEYLVKPVELKELGLRVRNILGHIGGNGGARGKINVPRDTIDNPEESDESSEMEIGDISINFDSQVVRNKNFIVHLSPKEYQILKILAESRGRVVSPEEIFEKVWFDHGSEFSEYTTTITVHMAYLRKKLGGSLIRTVKMSGYIIDNPS